MADAVAIAADQGAEESRLLAIAGQVVHAKDDVGELAGLIGSGEGGHDAAVGDDARLHPVGIGEGIEIDGRAVGHFAVRLFFTLDFLLLPWRSFLVRAGLSEAGERHDAQQGAGGPASVTHDRYGKRLQAARRRW